MVALHDTKITLPYGRTDPAETADDLSNVTPKCIGIVMQFIDRYEFEILYEGPPKFLMRQDRGMQHVKVGENDRGRLPNGSPVILCGVSIIRCYLNMLQSRAGPQQLFQCSTLILS